MGCHLSPCLPDSIEMTDEHLIELARQCATYTPLSRLNQTEQLAVFAWLIDGGHMIRTGKPLAVQALHALF